MVSKVSLLYRNACKKLKIEGENPDFIKDLQLDEILKIMTSGSTSINSERIIVSVFSEFCQDAEDISYRYEVLQDFIEQPQMFWDLKAAIDMMIPVEKERQLSNRRRTDVTAEYKLGYGVNTLLGYSSVCKKVGEVLKGYRDKYSSRGLNLLYEAIFSYVDNDNYYKLEKILLGLKKCTQGYIRIKLNAKMDTCFKLKDAVVLDIDNNGYVSKILERDEYIKARLSKGFRSLKNIGRKIQGNYVLKNIDYILEENANEIKDKTLNGIVQILETMIANISSFLRNLSDEMLFYEGALKLVQTMKKLGLVTSKAEMTPIDERTFIAEDLYDLSFALYLSEKGFMNPLEKIVTNDVYIKGDERIQIITGPNQGGKTTYIRAMGILQILAQAGIPVPAMKAVISPVDMIFTHFPADEKPESNEGRLGEELLRMRTIIEDATEHSLVLINEAFASTNSKEGSMIAQDILAAIAIIGSRCSFVTHLYELAHRVSSINNDLGNLGVKCSRLINMVAQYEKSKDVREEDSDVEVRKRTYKIIPGVPSKSSFAADIAAQFKIRYADFIQKLE